MKKNRAVYGVMAMAIASGAIGGYERQSLAQTEAETSSQGTLSLVANGEDFVRQGFVTKDGWQIDFDRVYVSMTEANAYQSEPAYEPETGDTVNDISYQETVSLLDSPQIIDLAAGEADAEPILVKKVNAPTGFYNAVAWTLAPAGAETAISGQTIVLQGTATKDDETINFDLGFNTPLKYVCGEFVGEERKGFVEVDNTAEVEATFHFDHIFGDSETPADDALNQDALGFQPLADLAEGNTLNINQDALATELSSENYQKLTEAIAGLGHVGEGHCAISSSNE
ncbi:hypothetical protein [Myxosarcina sp. GI1]|uniref:hypothetical protein n=1 Tax=Myxosarcina sp. GI1 TaxID=1541065 RepID=UPI00055D6518|nr:hypothetical protein [Myxosarcina sp. GI1]